MEVQIKKGDPARLEDYMDVMRDSILWERYYAPDESVLRGILTDALARGAVLTAETSAGEAVGLMQCEWQGMFGAWPYLALLGVKLKRTAAAWESAVCCFRCIRGDAQRRSVHAICSFASAGLTRARVRCIPRKGSGRLR